MYFDILFDAFHSYLCEYHDNISHPLPQKELVFAELPADPLPHEERLKLWRQSVEEVQAQPNAEYACPNFLQILAFYDFVLVSMRCFCFQRYWRVYSPVPVTPSIKARCGFRYGPATFHHGTTLKNRSWRRVASTPFMTKF
jgi:hypothetical protein